MNKKLLLLLFILYIIGLSEAQNLVPNHSFETQSGCPSVSEITVAEYWNSPTSGTPDLFNSNCPSQNSSALTGIGSAGFYAYSKFPNNREYIQVRLNESLIQGHTYCVEFNVKRTNFLYGIGGIGAYFDTDSTFITQTSVLNLVPQVENPLSNILGGTVWISISDSFLAQGGEEYMIIGNFQNDVNTQLSIENANSTDSIAYYKIDDISVVDCTSQDTTSIRELAEVAKMYPNPSSSQIHIDFKNSNSSFDVKLYSVIGVEVTNYTNVRDYINIDVAEFQNGYYSLQLIEGTKTYQSTLIIKH
ncbi:MAG: T9SS type A sorting domain-containing protein [Chitinophagales bacterium]|nr:T9SS type A sorting domain-containing protein [Chitinophagales bacterium]